MKRIHQLILIGLLISALPTFGQVDLDLDEPPTRYVFSKEKPLRVRGFGTAITELSSFNNDPALTLGGGAAALFNRKAWLGAYGMTTVTPLRDIIWDQVPASSNRYVQFTQVGGWLGYSFTPKRAIHISLSTKIGAGLWANSERGSTSPATWVVSPQADLELNMFRWMRASVGVGYRFVQSNSQVTRQNTVSSPTLSLGLSFGWFD